MTFKSPNRKDSTVDSQSTYKNLNLLNYMLFKEKKGSLGLKLDLPKQQVKISINTSRQVANAVSKGSK